MRHCVPEWLESGCSLAPVSNLAWSVISRGRDTRQSNVCWPSLPGLGPTVGWRDKSLHGVHCVSVPDTEWALLEPILQGSHWGHVVPELSRCPHGAGTSARPCPCFTSFGFSQRYRRQMHSAVPWLGWQGSQPHPTPFVTCTKSSVLLFFSLPHIIYLSHACAYIQVKRCRTGSFLCEKKKAKQKLL